jgi:protein SCO1/2
MLNHLLNPSSNEKFLRTIRVVFLIVLLATGYIIGLTINTLFQTNAISATTDATTPTGAALVEPPQLLQDFTLTSHTGDPIRLSDLRGQAILLFFGYTHCPDVCPTTLADYRRVKQALGEDADKAAFVFISVDGARDTPDVLTQYLRQFDSSFIGMTGDETTLRQVGAEYGLFFQEEAISVGHEHEDGYTHRHGDDLDTENYFMQHTSPSFLVDPDGYLRLVYFYGTEPEVIAEGIRQILR